MQQQTFEDNRDMAFIAVTYDASIFLWSLEQREWNEL